MNCKGCKHEKKGWFIEPDARFSSRKQKFLSTVQHQDRILGPTQPATQWVRGALLLVAKRPGREANHSPLTSAEVQNGETYT
jgi:hypothetical protein